MSEQRDRQVGSMLSFFPFQLMNVRLYEIQVKHREVDPETDEQLPLKVRILQDKSVPNADGFGLLLVFETFFFREGDDKGLSIYIAIEGLFEAIVDVETIKPDTIKQFKSRDAILLLWPYLRQALQDITTRIGVDIPVLPIIDARALLASSEDEETG